MGILEFIASLASSLAWPAVVVVLAIIFRVPAMALLEALHKRIPHLLRATGPGNTSIEFATIAEEAAGAAGDLPNPTVVSGSATPDGSDTPDGSGTPGSDTPSSAGEAAARTPRDEFQRPYFLDDERRTALSLEDPAPALLVTYGELQDQLRKFYSEAGLTKGSGHPKSSIRMAGDLVSEGLLPESFTNVLRPVTAARNALAHGQVPAKADRAEVRDLVDHCADLATNVWLHRDLFQRGVVRRYAMSDSPE